MGIIRRNNTKHMVNQNYNNISQITKPVKKDTAESKLFNLRAELKSFGKLAVAFSGGVDSSFLLKVASDVLGENAIAITLKSPSFPQRELDRAVEFAQKHKIRHILVESDELSSNDFIKNDRLRCYYCKTSEFKKVLEIAKKNDFNVVADGSNHDDLSDYRPGAKAAQELGVISPLKEHGFSKEEIRLLSKSIGLSGWDRPSFACLASRIPYGTPITGSLLEKIDNLETFLLEKGFSQVRVRHHGEIARLELAKEDFSRLFEKNLMPEIVIEFKKSGYLYVTLDLEGYRTGSMNIML